MIDKNTIREVHQKLRKTLSGEECSRLSQKIANQFFSSIDLSTVRTLHTFLPIVSKNEPDTWLIIERLQKEFPQVRLSIPKVHDDHLVNFYFDRKEQLQKNQWNILEPVNGEQTPIASIDLVLVPLLAFDSTGNRVGYGKGFYDKFLSKCRTDCKKVGLSFFESTDQLIPANFYDVRLNAVVTPTTIFHFKT